MTTDAQVPTTAEGVRQRNRELDERLREEIAAVPGEHLRDDPGDGEWSLAENLAHIGEFPRYFARELIQMIRSDVDVEVGRTHEHPERNEAIADAEGKDRDQLAAAVDTALDELVNALRHVSDDDLQRVFTNRKYGQEPLTAYLQRYVLGHKAAHVAQLHRTLAVVTG